MLPSAMTVEQTPNKEDARSTTFTDSIRGRGMGLSSGEPQSTGQDVGEPTSRVSALPFHLDDIQEDCIWFETSYTKMRQPLPGTRQTVVPDASSLSQRLVELGYGENQDGATMWSKAEDEYMRMTGDRNAILNLEMFIVNSAQLFGLHPRTAQAYYFASAIENGEPVYLTFEKYLLLRAAFIETPKEHEMLWRLRLRAAFYRFTLCRASWDESARITLKHIRATGAGMPMTRDDAEEWARRIVRTPIFVSLMTDAMLPRSTEEGSLISESDFMDIAKDGMKGLLRKFLERAIEQLDSLEASPDQHGNERNGFRLAFEQALMQRPNSCRKVVLSDRAITAYVSAQSSESDKSQARDMAIFRMADVPNTAINDELTIDPRLRAYGDWRGPLAPARDSAEQALAGKVVTVAMQVARELTKQPDVQDRHWMTNGQLRQALLGSTEEEQATTTIALAKACITRLQADPSLVRVKLPVKVFGDLHGQLRDLLMLFSMFGAPTTHQGGDVLNTKYVFNGDFVDRGEHQLEVVCVLFALKILFPQHIYLLRGNHEFRGMSVSMGSHSFLNHMKHVMPTRGPTACEAIHKAFDWLPLAALVDETVLVLHGGLGAGTWGIKDLESLHRPLRADRPEGPAGRVMLDAMWADPSCTDAKVHAGVHINRERQGHPLKGSSRAELANSPDEDDVRKSEAILEWGADVTKAFCKREKISLVVRSHQLVQHGYKYMHGGRLITVFSARNYHEHGRNDAAILYIADDLNGHMRVYPKQLKFVEPYRFEPTVSLEELDPSQWTHTIITAHREKSRTAEALSDRNTSVTTDIAKQSSAASTMTNISTTSAGGGSVHSGSASIHLRGVHTPTPYATMGSTKSYRDSVASRQAVDVVKVEAEGGCCTVQ